MPPPLPKCFSILNADYFTNLIPQINATASESELQDLVNRVYGDLSTLVSTIQSQIALLGPIEALLSPPTDLGSLISWVGNFITGFLTPYLTPFLNYAAQLTAIADQVTSLTSAIESAASGKGFSITIPSVEAVCTL